MPSLKEVRNRINSIKSTRQITSAMKMVAASKLHKAQQVIVHLRAYAENLRETLHEVDRQIPLSNKHLFSIDRGGKNVLVISIASNKGLCGTYNAQVIKRTLSHISYLDKQQQDHQLAVIGKKNEVFFKKRSFDIQMVDHEIIDSLTYEKARNLADSIMTMYDEGRIDGVDVVYHRFKNAVVQELVTERLLPLSFENILISAGIDIDESYPETFGSNPDERDVIPDEFGYILEPDSGQVLDTLVRQFIRYNLYRMLVDASASEHGARMTSMHKATDNADQLIKSLTLTYNKVRQAMITREIMEIMGGAGK